MPEKKIEDFPSVAEVKEHIGKQADQARPKTPWTRRVMVVLVVVIAVLLIGNLAQSGLVILPIEKGSVSGTVVNQMSTPVSADIFLEKSDLKTTTNNNGSFLLGNIPVGQRMIIVAYDGMGQEFEVEVKAGIIIELGQIRVSATQIAPVR